MTLVSLLPQLEFEPVVEEAVKHKIVKSRKQIEVIAETAYGSNDLDFPLCKRMPLTRLAVVTYLLAQKYTDYKSIGAAESIILDTFRDVSHRANLYYKQSGKIGISRDDVIWFRHIMNVHIFKIGILQYQKFNMIYLDVETLGEPYMVFADGQKEILPVGVPVINCHVQQGANICAVMVKDSLARARIFFKKCFESVQYRAFICYSWLLYPPMVQKLPEKSNIRQFADFFSIIGVCGDSAQAKENLFNYGKSNSPCASTSLQRMAKEHKEILGYGCGVIML